ncbi:uncharacterized protein LOC114286266 isoform X16 [Camellia sinensis]|uniref:uncharacterized protein LOC114286266 isoform X16 n=1 Tax=Camellia sinensis TaxID=4442 RepID=UPI001035F17C|nr:uncharacterized protein LOC114286266 isoform X16 [Camellia sinensis]
MHPLIDLIAHLTVSHSLVLHLHRSTLSHRKIGRSTDSRIAPIDLTGLGRIAGILSLEVEDGNTTLDSLQHVGSELAMHVVATKPLFLRKDLVSSDALENEPMDSEGADSNSPTFHEAGANAGLLVAPASREILLINDLTTEQ